MGVNFHTLICSLLENKNKIIKTKCKLNFLTLAYAGLTVFNNIK